MITSSRNKCIGNSDIDNMKKKNLSLVKLSQDRIIDTENGTNIFYHTSVDDDGNPHFELDIFYHVQIDTTESFSGAKAKELWDFLCSQAIKYGV